ncbi:MAG: TIR domain-containing protein, partial [Chloroflexota bacterium]
MTVTNRNQLRQFINKHFNINELLDLCFDYFPAVKEELGDNPRKSVLILELIEYSERHGKYDSLEMALQASRPELFKKLFGLAVQKKQKIVSLQQEVQRNPKRIFLSHSTKDGVFAGQLANELRGEGWEVWIAPESIENGEKWEPAIERGLRSSSIFLLLISPNAAKSEFVRDETVIAREMARKGELRLIF